MGETRELLKWLFVIFVVGVIGIFVSRNNPLFYLNSLYCEKANFTLKIDKEINLKETYVYKVNENNRYRMLYRYWKVPLSVKETLNKPYVKIEEIKSNQDYYVKDWKGKIWGKLKNLENYQLVQRLAQRNEVGIVKSSYFKKGTYSFSSNYLLFPPVHTDGIYYHFNLKLADKHIPYKKITVTILDPQNSLEEIFPHFTVSKIKKEKGKIVLEGRAGENELVEVEVLAKRPVSSPFYARVKGVKEKTERFNKWVYPSIYLSNVAARILTFTVFLLPFLVLFLYLRFGSEKNFTVPKYLSFLPSKRKPYVVNLIFSKDAEDTDENAFYSTLLDLHQQKVIKLLPSGELEILSEKVKDPYERKVLKFLREFSIKRNGKLVFSPTKIREKVENLKLFRNVKSLKTLKEKADKVLSYKDHFLTKKFIDTKFPNLVKKTAQSVLFTSLIFVIFSIPLSQELPFVDYYKVLTLLITLNLQLLLLAGLPVQLLGRWKENFYQEKLKWEAFKNFLTNFPLIQKYSPEDLSIWKEWLIYGTALGVGEEVARNMEKLKVQIPEVENFNSFRFHFSSFYLSLNESISELSPSSGSSGFGSGGGFGGGGAGGR